MKERVSYYDQGLSIISFWSSWGSWSPNFWADRESLYRPLLPCLQQRGWDGLMSKHLARLLKSTTWCFYHHHLHEEGPPLRLTWPSPRSTSRRTGWKIPQIPQKQKPKNFSRHLYYLKMQITLELNRIPGVPIPFSLWETLPFWPPVLPKQPSPEKKVSKNLEQGLILNSRK